MVVFALTVDPKNRYIGASRHVVVHDREVILFAKNIKIKIKSQNIKRRYKITIFSHWYLFQTKITVLQILKSCIVVLAVYVPSLFKKYKDKATRLYKI